MEPFRADDSVEQMRTKIRQYEAEQHKAPQRFWKQRRKEYLWNLNWQGLKRSCNDATTKSEAG